MTSDKGYGRVPTVFYIVTGSVDLCRYREISMHLTKHILTNDTSYIK